MQLTSKSRGVALSAQKNTEKEVRCHWSTDDDATFRKRLIDRRDPGKVHPEHDLRAIGRRKSDSAKSN
jgi:hypothetical protein